jgi:hypothetical protein
MFESPRTSSSFTIFFIAEKLRWPRPSCHHHAIGSSHTTVSVAADILTVSRYNLLIIRFTFARSLPPGSLINTSLPPLTTQYPSSSRRPSLMMLVVSLGMKITPSKTCRSPFLKMNSTFSHPSISVWSHRRTRAFNACVCLDR